MLQSLKPPIHILKQLNQKSTTEKQKKVFKPKDIQKEKKVFTLKDIGFFDPSLKFNFSKLRLYHNVNIFVNQISCDQYHEVDIVQLFSKCLRGAAYM